MANTRRYHPQVADDLARATSYYDTISVDLGSRFRQSVRQCLSEVTERPNAYATIEGELRAAMTNTFPYVVLYEHSSSVVTIVGIHHAASDPESWAR